ncbi:hypothetical protein ABZ372_10765, partial [Streptomyces sp. NPDC005921]
PKPAPVTGAARRTVGVLASAVRTGPFWLLAGCHLLTTRKSQRFFTCVARSALGVHPDLR